MKNKNAVLLAFIAVSIFLIFKLKQKDQDTRATTDAVVATEAIPSSTMTATENQTPVETALSQRAGTASSSEAIVTSASTPAPVAEATKRKRKLQPVSKLLPAIEQAREEVAADPHVTPKSVILFSEDLGDRLDAVKNEQQADAFMNELDACVTKPARPTTESAKTLCLLNANKLAKKYPTLDAKYSNLENRADPRVRSAVKFLK